MTSDGRAQYTPLTVKDGKGELEEVGMVLPSLTAQTVSSSKSWHRKAAISAIILTALIVLIAIIVGVVSSKDTPAPAGEPPANSPSLKEPEKQIKSELNFQIELRRAYDKIMDEKRPEDLKKDFDYYKTELSDVRNPSDLSDFLALMGMKRLRFDLTDEDVRYAVTETGDLHRWYTYLEDLRTRLTGYDTRKTVLTPPAGMNGRKKKEFDALLMEWTGPIRTDVSETRTVFTKRVILISEVLKLLRTDPKLLKKNIYVFASVIIYLDEDISLPETNLALIAPSWSFVKEINISLNGSDGAKHERSRTLTGEHGLPGRRGGNGGYFFGVGNMTWDKLHVVTDGGRGSDGQHGSNGRDGTVKKPEGFTVTSRYLCKKPISVVKNIYGKYMRYYEVYHAYGCGGNGTDGGAPGPGGKGGDVILFNLRDNQVKNKTGRTGESGIGGMGGSGGSGANWGCLFYAEESDDDDMEQVTREVCGSRMPNGFPGRDGWNTAGLEEPEDTNSSFFSDVLRELRAYAREEYVNGREDIWSLTERLDILDTRATVKDFLEELNAIEKPGKMEFYRSVMRRLEKAEIGKEVLTYLRTLTHGKALALKSGIDNYVIVDLDMFLEKVSDDLKSTDKRSLTFADHTTPVYRQLLKGKMNYLGDALNQWLYKTSKLIADSDLTLSRNPVNLPGRIDERNMAYLTSLTAGVIKSLTEKVLGDGKEMTVNITVDDLVTHSDSKSCSGRFVRHRSRLLTKLESLHVSNWKTNLRDVKHLLEILNNLIDEQSEVSDFPVVLEYFESTAGLLETVRERQKFNEYVAEVNGLSAVSDEVTTIRDYLFDTFITAQYRNALNVFRQWVFPHMHAYESLLPKNKTLTLEDAETGISVLRKSVKEYKSTITSYDKFIREAVFTGNNSVGEYYKWYNDDIRSDLTELLKGRAISLTADVENFHMTSKNAIKFRTVQLEFQSRHAELLTLLANVQVEMKHSGYSYYYYNGRSYLQTGEGFDLRYSFERSPNGLPVNFNMVYKKLMDGPPIFSPYTTWTIRLNPVPEELVNFADDVDIALVGLGSYIEVVDN